MSNEDISELMQDPPGGKNYGRRKSPGGKWQPLEAVDWSNNWNLPAPLEAGVISSKSSGQEPRKHGGAYTYQKIGCRCPACRKWWADYVRGRRQSGGKDSSSS